MKDIIIGIDLGGTKIAVGLVSAKGKILSEQMEAPSEAKTTFDRVIKNIAGLVNECLEKNSISKNDILAAGIGSPGPIDMENGIILNPQNLPALHNRPLRDVLQKELDVPVFLNNDATCFVLGEALFGAGKGFGIVCGLTLGTGLGCGLAINGRPYDGATGTSTEIWGTRYLDGTIEDYTSGKGIRKLYESKTGKSLYAWEIADLGFAGDTTAVESWKEYGYHLGMVLSGLINFIDPHVIVLGGSVAKSFELFKESMFNTLYENINSIPREKLKVLPYQLGDHSGFVGAAALAMHIQQ